MTRKLTQLFLLLVAATGSFTHAESASPHQWLDRMSSAVQSLSYAGTVVRIGADGETESLKVAHTIRDGMIRERVVAQEGTGFEIVRNGNEVRYILPDKKIVRVEQWNDQSTLFSTLPSSELRLGSDYDVIIKRKARVAGREALELAIQPHDNYRYGHRLWLDTETGFPLRTELIGDDGEPLEQVRFVDISLNPALPTTALNSTLALDIYFTVTVSPMCRRSSSRRRMEVSNGRPCSARRIPSAWSAMATG